MQIMFTLSLFICLCRSFVLGFAKTQQHKIERLEGIQFSFSRLLLRGALPGAPCPKITTHKTLFPKKF